MQHRKLLINRALRCINEDTKPAERLGNALHASHAVWTAYGQNGVKIGRITSGKVGACARDMVSDCRACGKIICRVCPIDLLASQMNLNCVVKAPPTTLLKLRHRRLCRTCMKSPLDGLTTVVRAVGEDGTPSRRVVCHPSLRSCGVVLTLCRGNDDDAASPFADDQERRTYSRDRCTCAEIVWICQPCGQTMRTDDTTYVRGWKWRTRYSHCGGMGAGLGEGNEGVECGRTRDCLAARMVEKDVECCAEELAALQMEMSKAEGQGRHWNGSSYSTQEIVGIGGKVKTKVKKRVPVGAIVKEYEDERETEQFLGREQSGANRSWCSWCSRVVVSKKDMDGATRSTDSIASSSSVGSV
ncbi:hypothetical protein PRZ48_004448 [Zasmidium cellare]|uniref:Uncharacterized protein n=1 Tax=Zasmidium cellare TaxID=395010 RepID=A0ABR0ER06_ZASCE|nr:hypothetical protein PRZ48_004448 [Zasmidium cellare]